MAISPVDRNPELMQEDHGTVCLVTDTKADRYLNLWRKQQSQQKYEVPYTEYFAN